jgi:NAD(P)-dependent dehydrogenase (short-subunit alcohol dehydrogenase family)
VGSLDGKVAVVLGASRGIGRGIAQELGAAGAVVYAAGRSLHATPGHFGSLTETAEWITAQGGTAVPVRCDAMVDAEVAALFDRVKADHGKVDVLVNSVFNSPDFGSSIGSRFWELPLDIWRDVFDIGTRTAYVASFYAAPLLLAAGRGSLIVNVSGRGASRYRYNVAYGVGKAALDKMTRDMAVELEPEGIAVVSIWPNVTRTEHMDAARAADPNALHALGDIDTFETPRYSGRVVAALACDEDLLSRTGTCPWVAELAAHYRVVDELGRQHPLPE